MFKKLFATAFLLCVMLNHVHADIALSSTRFDLDNPIKPYIILLNHIEKTILFANAPSMDECKKMISPLKQTPSKESYCSDEHFHYDKGIDEKYFAIYTSPNKKTEILLIDSLSQCEEMGPELIQSPSLIGHDFRGCYKSTQNVYFIR